MNDAIAKTLMTVGLALVGVAFINRVSKTNFNLGQLIDALENASEEEQEETDDEFVSSAAAGVVYADLMRRINRAERSGKSSLFLARARTDAYRFLQTGNEYHLSQAERSLWMAQ